MKTFLSSVGMSVVVYGSYFLGVSYFGPSFYVGANAGPLFVVIPILFLVLVGAYLWYYQHKPLAVIGIFVGFLIYLLALLLVLSGS
jgi:hypothetical protein